MPNNQEQAVEGGSIALQAEQISDVTIINNGVSITEIIPICNQLFDMNFPRLRDEAAKIANSRVDEFATSLRDTLNNDIQKIVLNKFADPDVQFLLTDALRNVARKGSKAHPEILIDLIKLRVIDAQPEFVDIVTTQAVEVLTKITDKHLHFLLMLFLSESLLFKLEVNNYFLREKYTKDIYIQQQLKSIEDDFVFNLKKLFEEYALVVRPQIDFLQSIGLVMNNTSTFAYSVFDHHFNHYNQYFSFKDKAQFELYLKECAPTYYQLLKGYDAVFNGRNYGLSSIGNQIAISYIKSNGHEGPALNKFVF